MKKKLFGWLLAACGVGICLLGLAYAVLFILLLFFQPCGADAAAHRLNRWMPVLILIAAGGIYYLLACAGIAAWRGMATRIILLLEIIAILVVLFASLQGSADYVFLVLPGDLGFSGLGILLFRYGRRISIS